MAGFKNLDMIDLLSLLKTNRTKIYSQIVSDSEDGTSGLVTEAQLRADALALATLILANGEADTDTSIGAIQHAMQTTYLVNADLDPSVASYFDLTPITEDDAKYEEGYRYISASGTYYKSIMTKIEADAEAIIETYNLIESTSAKVTLKSGYQELINFEKQINGQIRRGFITVDGTTYFGIAISSQEIFSASASTQTVDGEVYYQISDGACFGLYTATGWQYWISGKKVGWFDSSDEHLHVGSIDIDDELVMGEWILKHDDTKNTFGIKFIGA